MDKKKKQKIINIFNGLIMLAMATFNGYLFWFFSMVHYETDFNPLIKAFLFVVGLNMAYFMIFYVKFFNKAEGKDV